MKDNAFTRSFAQSRTILTLWYVAFCLALIALLNFGAFAAQTSSLQIPKKTVGFDQTTSEATIAINADNASALTTVGEIEKRFGQMLIIADSILIAWAIPLSYILSGLTLRPVRKVMQQQEEFAQEVSHELRTPLTAVSLEVESLKRNNNVPPDTLIHISDELKRMNRLTDGLLTLLRPEEKGKSSKLGQPSSLAEAAQATFLRFQKIAKAKHITCVYNAEFAGDVLADRQDVEQCIGILLENAIKYSPEGSSLTVTVGMHAKREAFVAVKDTGPGMSKEDLAHVFDRFYRGKNGGASSSGLGLGLAIAKKIVTLHSGRVTIDSQVDKGTVANIYLPVAQS